MLFNSYQFILIFLPIVLVFFILVNENYRFKIMLLTLASILFYAYWNVKFTGLLLLSIIINYALSKYIKRRNKSILYLSIFLNLALLGTFKYLGMFLDIFTYYLSKNILLPDFVLPLGISFYTFQQIVFQIDNYNNKVKNSDILEYTFFVTFFPQIIAGPIVHHKEIFSQIKKKVKLFRNFFVGISIFSIGLLKKVFIADNLAITSDSYFSAITSGYNPSILESFLGTLSFTVQIYFDFSAYSDMALGLAYIFGFKLPLNFASPYQAKSISEFWRRWHITLSRFFKNYLYIPLGGNSKGIFISFINLFLVMSLAGLWHGASVNFILWGMIHGVFFVINHGYKKISEKLKFLKIHWFLCWFITFFCINLSWVPFRTTNLSEALVVWKSMFSINNFYLPESIEILGLPTKEFLQNIDYTGSFLLIFSLFIVLLVPNVYQLFSKYNFSFKSEGYFTNSYSKINFKWQANYLWLILSILAIFLCFGEMSENKEFLYFQF